MLKNRQPAALSLSGNALQVILSGILGDGCITTTNSNSTYFKTNCKYEEYIDFKSTLLGNMFKHKTKQEHNGYCQTPIFIIRSKSNPILKLIKNWSINEILDHLNDLGIALWFYDDGSLHKTKLFYNLNTHAFPKEIQEQYFIPFFNKLGIYPKIQIERKKDGRIFWYLRIGKFSGADKISTILEKYPLKCYSYKRWSSETIQLWSRFQEKLKSTNTDLHLSSKQKAVSLLRQC